MITLRSLGTAAIAQIIIFGIVLVSLQSHKCYNFKKDLNRILGGIATYFTITPILFGISILIMDYALKSGHMMASILCSIAIGPIGSIIIENSFGIYNRITCNSILPATIASTISFGTLGIYNYWFVQRKVEQEAKAIKDPRTTELARQPAVPAPTIESSKKASKIYSESDHAAQSGLAMHIKQQLQEVFDNDTQISSILDQILEEMNSQGFNNWLNKYWSVGYQKIVGPGKDQVTKVLIKFKDAPNHPGQFHTGIHVHSIEFGDNQQPRSFTEQERHQDQIELARKFVGLNQD